MNGNSKCASENAIRCSSLSFVERRECDSCWLLFSGSVIVKVRLCVSVVRPEQDEEELVKRREEFRQRADEW